MIPSDYIYDYVINDLDLYFPVYIGPSNERLDSHTAIIDTNSNMNPRWLRDTYNIQIFGYYQRADYARGYEDMSDIRDAIVGKPPEEVDGDVWLRFLLVNGPSFIGVDSNGRNMFSMNFEITKDPSQGQWRDAIQ